MPHTLASLESDPVFDQARTVAHRAAIKDRIGDVRQDFTARLLDRMPSRAQAVFLAAMPMRASPPRDPSEENATDRIEREATIRNLARLVRMPEEGERLIAVGASIATARKHFVDAQAAKSDVSPIDGALDPNGRTAPPVSASRAPATNEETQAAFDRLAFDHYRRT